MTIPTSYFSSPEQELDPKLFEGRHLRSWARTGVLSVLKDFLGLKYRHSDIWSHAWLAGSGVSYQWSAAREPQDLDCLIGVDFIQFRKANPEFAGLLDKEISEQMNEEFHEELHGQTENWNGYELTFYVNPIATDIRTINPYAAYDLKYDEWTVTPDPNAQAPKNAEWDQIVENDRQQASQARTRVTQAVQDIQSAHNEPLKRNAEVRLNAAAQQANALYTQIHENRSMAFSPSGSGYGDFHNYRWQAGKRAGTIQDLRSLRRYLTSNAQELYGVELPSTSTLIRRAALHRNQ
jgi:hypothetical protein